MPLFKNFSLKAIEPKEVTILPFEDTSNKYVVKNFKFIKSNNFNQNLTTFKRLVNWVNLFNGNGDENARVPLRLPINIAYARSLIPDFEEDVLKSLRENNFVESARYNFFDKNEIIISINKEQLTQEDIDLINLNLRKYWLYVAKKIIKMIEGNEPFAIFKIRDQDGKSSRIFYLFVNEIQEGIPQIRFEESSTDDSFSKIQDIENIMNTELKKHWNRYERGGILYLPYEFDFERLKVLKILLEEFFSSIK